MGGRRPDIAGPLWRILPHIWNPRMLTWTIFTSTSTRNYCIRWLLDNNVETTIQPMFNTESVVCFKGLKWLCHFPNYSIFVGPPKQTSLLFQDVVDDVIPRHKLGFQLFWLYSPFSTHIDMENPVFVDYCPKGKPLVSPTKPFRKPLLIKKVSNG